MPKCKMCDRKGLFLKVSKDGLCKFCEPILLHRVSEIHRVMSDCIKIIDKSKNADTKLSRCNLLLDRINDLVYYEKSGIPTISPAPSKLSEKYFNIRNDIVLEKARLIIDKELNKAKKIKTVETKIEYAKVALKKLNEFKEKVKKLSLSTNIYKEFDILEKRINDFISSCV